MCRLAAFPPMFPRDKALEVLHRIEGSNTDGIGSAYVKNGEFVVDKYPVGITQLETKYNEFLSHMPYDGWTIAHMRAASHGEVCDRNTHPFITQNKEWCICHNGVWSDYKITKMVLKSVCKIDFNGETDSEVAAE